MKKEHIEYSVGNQFKLFVWDVSQGQHPAYCQWRITGRNSPRESPGILSEGTEYLSWDEALAEGREMLNIIVAERTTKL